MNQELQVKIDNMIEAIEQVKEIVNCDDSNDNDCSESCPINLVCKQMNKIQMWANLTKIY